MGSFVYMGPRVVCILVCRGVPAVSKVYHIHYKDERGTGGKESVHVYCETCRYLGSFYVTPEQHLEGVMRRVDTMKEGHVCGQGT